MKSNIAIGVIGTAGLVTGIVAGRQFPAKGSAGPTALQMEESVEAKGSRRSASTTKDGEHGLPRLLRVVRNYHAAGDPETVREIERLDTPELRRLIEELVTTRKPDASAESQAVGRLIQGAIKEWYRREGEKALQQAVELTDEKARQLILSQLINAAAYENPELGKTWADRFREKNGKDWYWSMINEAFQGAASRSAEDFLRVKEIFKGEQMYSASYGPFAEDFDFGKVIATMPLGHGAENMLSRWAAKDPDAAWGMARTAVSEHGAKAASYVGGVFQGISSVKGDDEAAAWLASHIGEVPEAARRRVFESLRSVDFLGPDRAATVMAALAGNEERMLFASVLIDPHFDQGTGLAGLKALDSDAARVGALMATAKEYSRGMGNGGEEHFNKVHGYFDRTMEALNLSPQTRETVKAALAPPEEVEEP